MNKKLFSFIVITTMFAITFMSCDKDNDEDSSPTPFSGGISGTIEGECAGWDLVSISLGEREFVETTPIIDGKFTFTSLPIPKPEDLEPFIESEEKPTNIQISDKEIKVCHLSLLAIKGAVDASYEGRSIIQIVNSSNYITMIEYYYADRDVKIKGSDSGTEMGIKYSSEINLNLQRGWNTVHIIMSGTEKDGLTTILKNGVPPSGTVWTTISL